MTWRYQVIRYPGGELGIHELYSVHGKEGWTQCAVGVIADSRWGLLRVLWRMAWCSLRYGPMDDPDTRWTLTAKGRAMLSEDAE